MDLFLKKFPGRHAALLLILLIVIGIVFALDRLFFTEFHYVDALWLIPVIYAAILLSPLETVAVGLTAALLELLSLHGLSERADTTAAMLIGAAGILGAVKASLIRRYIRRISSTREAVENSPLAYAEFKFPGYSLINSNRMFIKLSELATGPARKHSLQDCFPEETSAQLAKYMDEAISARRQADCEEFHILLDGRTTFWRISFIPISPTERGAPASIAVFAFEVTDAVARARTREAVLRVSAQAMSSLSLDETTRGVLDGLVYIAHSEAGALFLLEDDQWVGKAVYGKYDGDPIERLRFPYDDFSGAVKAIEDKEVILGEDIRIDPRFNQEMVRKFGIRSSMVVPLVTANRSVGVAYLANTEKPQEFTDEQIKFATVIGSHGALAIENAMIYQNERIMRKSLEAIEVVSEAGLVSLDLDEVLMELVNRTQDVMHMDAAMILLHDQDENCLVGRAATGGVTQSAVSQIRINVGQGIAGRCFQEGVPMKIDDIRQHREDVCPLDACFTEQCPFLDGNGITSVLAVPLKVSGKVFGVLQIGSNNVAAFSARDWGLIQVLADRASLAVQNSMLHERTRRELARAAMLRDVAAACAVSHDTKTISRLALQAIYKQLGCKVASIYYFDQEQDALVNLAFLGHPENIVRDFRFIRLDRGTLLTRAVNERRMLTQNDINPNNASDSEAYVLQLMDIGYNRWVTLPIIYKEEVVGAMALVFPDSRSFSPEGLDTINSIANQLAVVLKRSPVPEEMQAMEVADD